MTRLLWKVLFGVSLLTVMGVGIARLMFADDPEQADAHSAPPKGDPGEGLKDEVETLRATVQSIRSQQAQLARTLEQQQAGAPAPAPSKDEPSAVPAPEAADARLDLSDRESIDQLTTQLEQRMDAEPRDSRWAPQTEAELARTLSQEPFQGSRLQKVSCRSSLCRAEISHSGDEAQDAFLENLPLEVPGKTGFFQKVEEPGSEPRTLVFLAREGAELALMPKP